MMKEINQEQRVKIKRNIESSSDYITSNLEKIVSDNWLELGTVEQTAKRLKRKGNRKEADQYLQHHEEADNVRLSPRGGLQVDNADQKAKTEEINKIVKEGIVGSDDMISSNFLHKGSMVSRAVGRIIDKSSREPVGTGFLVSPNLIITNNHVISDEAAAHNCVIEFNFVSNELGGPIKSNEFELEPERLFFTSHESEYDFSIVAIQPENSAGEKIQQLGAVQLIEETGKAHVGERLNIIHHPLGKPQQISIRKNLLVTHDESPVYLKYMTDTEPGSSGAPVFNDEWELVALHRAAEIIENENQKKLFFQAMKQLGEDSIQEYMGKEVTINFGVRISFVANHIKSRLTEFNPDQQVLLEEIFNPQRRATSGKTDEKSPFESFAPSPNPNVQGFAPLSQGGTQVGQQKTSPFPLNISISIGEKNEVLHSTNQPSETTFTENPATKTQLELYSRTINSQKSVFKALSFLEEARNRKYLPDQEELEEVKNSYYQSILEDIAGNGLDKKQMYNRLHALISKMELVDKFPDATIHLESLIPKHRLESIHLEGGGVAYAKARAHLYTWVDLQEDRMLQAVYTQMAISPEQLMLKDLINSLDIEGVELPQRFRNNQFMNCEHIVPKSLFDNDRLGFSDLHHLITAEGATNTFRNNRPYRQLGNEGTLGPAKKLEFIKFGGKKTTAYFEPLRNKALVARATLYFIVCHKEKLPSTVYNPTSIKTLIKWARSEKPSRYEQHRNEAIHDLQGNRNPFIDFPEWVSKVDFSLGLREE